MITLFIALPALIIAHVIIIRSVRKTLKVNDR